MVKEAQQSPISMYGKATCIWSINNINYALTKKITTKLQPPTAYHLRFIRFPNDKAFGYVHLSFVETRQKKKMFTFPSFLKSCFCFHLIALNEAREIHFEAHSSFRFDNFAEHKSRYLEVPKHSEVRVLEFVDCAMKCLTAPRCISLNMASSKDGEEKFWCELLLDDMFNNSQSFNENSTSHHFSKWVSL